MEIASILLVIQGINAALAAAPGAIEVITKAKELITALFTAKAITKEQQDAIHIQVDATAALVSAGIVPIAWQVEPDPAD